MSGSPFWPWPWWLGQNSGGGQPLAKVVAQRREAHRQLGGKPAGLCQHHHGVDAGIDLRVPLGGGRHPEQGIQLGEQRSQGAALAQHLEEHLWGRSQQYLLQLLPDSLRGQVSQLAGLGHLAHQCQRLGGHHEALGVEAGGEAGHPQNAQRIFSKGGGDVAKQPLFQILDAAIGIVQLSRLILGDGVDGEIPAQQILLQRHLRRGVADEAGITATLLALGAGQRVLLLGLGVQEHGKIAAHLGKAQRQHLFHGRPDHQVIPVALRQSQQAIPHCAPNQISLQAVSPLINLSRLYRFGRWRLWRPPFPVGGTSP